MNLTPSLKRQLEFAERLLEIFEAHPGFVKPAREHILLMQKYFLAGNLVYIKFYGAYYDVEIRAPIDMSLP